MFSALPPNSDVARCGRHFAFVPEVAALTGSRSEENHRTSAEAHLDLFLPDSRFGTALPHLQFDQLLRTLRHHQRNGSSPPMNAYRVLRHVWILLMAAPIPAWAGTARVY